MKAFAGLVTFVATVAVMFMAVMVLEMSGSVSRSHAQVIEALKVAETWKRLWCNTTEGRTSIVCQNENPPIVKPVDEQRDHNPRVVM